MKFCVLLKKDEVSNLSDAGAMPAGDLQGGPEGREKEKAVRGPHQADQGRGAETGPNGL